MHGQLRFLILEDDPECQRDIRDLLKAQMGHKVGEIIIKDSEEEYLQVQKNSCFDVIILDIRLLNPTLGAHDADEDGGVRVSKRLRLWNPGSLVIVFSGYLNIEIAVAVMRNGAWDCIQKSDELRDVKLIRSIKEGLRESSFSSEWFRRHLEKLSEDYGGEHIAVADQKIVEHDENYDVLIAKLRKQNPKQEFALYFVPINK